MAWETRDTTSDRQEMDDVTADTTAPVAPSGGTQSLAGSPTAVFAASEDFGAAWQTPSSSERPEAPLSERVARAGRELATLMERFPRQAPVDPLADFAPMGALLAGR